MVECFTSIIPCYFSLTSDYSVEFYTLVIDINRSSVIFKLFNMNYGGKEFTEFKYFEYNALNVYSSGCVFINDANPDTKAYFKFFNNDNDIKRFLFILTDAGLLIPQDYNLQDSNLFIDQAQFELLHHHSFIPKGNYTFIYPSIITNVKKILKNRVKTIKSDDCIPFNVNFYEKVYPFLHTIEERKISKLKIINQKKISDSFKSPNQSTLIIKMVSHARANNKQDYKQLKKEMKRNQGNNKYSFFFEMIESDYQKIADNFPEQLLSSIYTEKITKRISLICMNICKVYVVSQKVEYFQNNFFIALKIALLLIGGDRINDFVECSFAGNSKKEQYSILESIPRDVKKITENENEFESLLYTLYSYLMKSLSESVSSLMDNSFKFYFSHLEFLNPYSAAYFILKNIDSFNFLEEMVKNLFLFSFKSPWIVWLFIVRTNNQELAIKSVIASLIYHLVPRLIEQKIYTETKIKEFLPNFEQELQNDSNLIKDIVDVATCFYFYKKPATTQNSML